MIQTAVAAFVGAFAAIAVLAETGAIASKLLRYLLAFVGGILATVVLLWVLVKIAEAFSHLHGG